MKVIDCPLVTEFACAASTVARIIYSKGKYGARASGHRSLPLLIVKKYTGGR
jgi:hypothetical protein